MSALSEISAILADRYDAGLGVRDPIFVLWAADRCSDPVASLAAANKVRAKHGLVIARRFDMAELCPLSMGAA